MRLTLTLPDNRNHNCRDPWGRRTPPYYKSMFRAWTVTNLCEFEKKETDALLGLCSRLQTAKWPMDFSDVSTL